MIRRRRECPSGSSPGRPRGTSTASARFHLGATTRQLDRECGCLDACSVPRWCDRLAGCPGPSGCHTSRSAWSHDPAPASTTGLDHCRVHARARGDRLVASARRSHPRRPRGGSGDHRRPARRPAPGGWLRRRGATEQAGVGLPAFSGQAELGRAGGEGQLRARSAAEVDGEPTPGDPRRRAMTVGRARAGPRSTEPTADLSHVRGTDARPSRSQLSHRRGTGSRSGERPGRPNLRDQPWCSATSLRAMTLRHRVSSAPSKIDSTRASTK